MLQRLQMPWIWAPCENNTLECKYFCAYSKAQQKCPYCQYQKQAKIHGPPKLTINSEGRRLTHGCSGVARVGLVGTGICPQFQLSPGLGGGSGSCISTGALCISFGADLHEIRSKPSFHPPGERSKVKTSWGSSLRMSWAQEPSLN